MVPFQHSWDVHGSTWAWNVTGYEGGCFVHSSSQVTEARRITNLQSLWKESGFSTNAIVCKLPELFLGTTAADDGLTGKYPFYRLESCEFVCIAGRPIELWSVKVNLSFILYMVNDSKYSKGFHYCHIPLQEENTLLVLSVSCSLFIILSDNSECFFLSFALCLKTLTHCASVTFFHPL